MRVAIIDDYLGIALDMADWGSLPPGTDIQRFTDHLTSEDALVDRLKDFDVIVAMRERTPFTASLFARLPKLKLLVAGSLHSRAVDWDAARARGIVVSGTDSHGDAVIELTWGLIFAVMRHIPEEDRAIREGRWQVTVGRTLGGKTLGVVGLGRLGARMATIGRAFGMEVIAWSSNLTPERAKEVGARAVSKEELFRRADVVTVMLALGERTRGIIGAKEFALMKREAYLVNTARGPIVDEKALIAALENRLIAGAGLDVFDVEPLPADHPFKRLPNTVLAPHNGHNADYKWRTYYQSAVENIKAWLDGKPIRVRNPLGKDPEVFTAWLGGKPMNVLDVP